MKITNKINLDLDNALLDNFNLEALDIGELQLKGGNFITDHPGLSAGIGIALFTIAAIADHKFALIDRFRNGNPLYHQLAGEEVVMDGKLYKKIQYSRCWNKEEGKNRYLIGSSKEGFKREPEDIIFLDKISGDFYRKAKSGNMTPISNIFPSGSYFIDLLP